jgi:hypothetical protein
MTKTKGPQFDWEPLVKEAAFVILTPVAQRFIKMLFAVTFLR